jgi:ABC-2 type transport system permease protein
MSAVITIGMRDLRAYFSSLKGSVTFFFMLIFMGLFFQSFCATYLQLQEQASQFGGQAPGLSQLLTAIFQNMHFILLFIVPAVTMSSFAEDRKTQVDRLLMKAPVSVGQIVIGKFFAAASILGLVLVASSVFPLYLFLYGNPDLGPIITAYLGIFLLMCSQVSIGLWISSLVSHQFLAFLFTAFALFLMLILAWIAPNLSSSGATEEMVKYLAATSHLDNFFSGLLSVADISYFLIFSVLFLFFTFVSVDSQRWR